MINIPKYKYVFAFIDLILINLSFLLSLYILDNKQFNFHFSFEIISVSILISINFLLFFQNNNLYKINIILSIVSHLTFFLRSLFYGTITLVFIAFLLKNPFILDSRKFVLIFVVVTLFLFLFFRIFLFRKIFIKFSDTEAFKRKILIIGAGKLSKLLAMKLEFENNIGISIVGFLDDNKPVGSEVIRNIKILGKIENLEKISYEKNIDEAILAIDNISYERILEILDICHAAKIPVKLTSELFNVIPQKIITEKYSDFSVINLSPQINTEVYKFIKRVIDLIGAIFGILLLSPLFIVIAFIIKITSPGPVFYKQIRIGKNGKPFKFIKFRSMTVENEEDEERKEMMIKFMKEGKVPNEKKGNKIINESRVTWIGKIIRKTSIDELPQLFNVIKGDMSLVGPRPCLPYEYENYDEWQKRRLSVLPGCTGVWQVFGRNNVSFKDSVVMDIFYINNMSPWFDIQLIIKTIPVMLFAKGGE